MKTLARSRITAQGQVSVPAEVRRRLGVEPGSVLEWEAEGDLIVVRRVGSHDTEDVHRAFFPAEPEPHTLDELDDGRERYVREKHARR